VVAWVRSRILARWRRICFWNWIGVIDVAAFVRAHPAVTSVLVGPRTQEQLDSLLPAAEIDLSADILDRIDEIVAPGTELDPADNYNATPPAIEHAHLRRR
jgi:hypothetical protein